MNSNQSTGFRELFNNVPSPYMNILESFIILLILILIYVVVLRVVRRQTSSEAFQYKWRKNLAYILSFLGFILIGRIWFQGMGSLATFLRLLSAGIAIALRDAEQQVLRAKKSYQIQYKNPTPIIHTEVVDIGIKFTIRHLSHARHRRVLNKII